MIVPDGVAKVRFVLTSDSRRRHSPSLILATAPVQDNAVAIQSKAAAPANPHLVTWYAPDGHVVKRIRAASR